MDVIKEVPAEYPQADGGEKSGFRTGMDDRSGQVIFEIDGTKVVVRSSVRSPVRRARRIAGYLNEIGNLNNAKRAKLKQRTLPACSAR